MATPCPMPLPLALPLGFACGFLAISLDMDICIALWHLCQLPVHDGLPFMMAAPLSCTSQESDIYIIIDIEKDDQSCHFQHLVVYSAKYITVKRCIILRAFMFTIVHYFTDIVVTH